MRHNARASRMFLGQKRILAKATNVR